MGLDIIQGFDLEEKDEDFELYDLDHSDDYELSRAFCNFMCRRSVVGGEADLDQIGRIFNIDISSLYQMESYMTSWEMEEEFHFEEDPEESIKEAEAANSKLVGNIVPVIQTLKKLIPALEKAKNISDQIVDNGFETIHSSYYTELDSPSKGDYLDNNLVQDLRNILRSCELAESKGARTTFFTYG